MKNYEILSESLRNDDEKAFDSLLDKILENKQEPVEFLITLMRAAREKRIGCLNVLLDKVDFHLGALLLIVLDVADSGCGNLKYLVGKITESLAKSSETEKAPEQKREFNNAIMTAAGVAVRKGDMQLLEYTESLLDWTLDSSSINPIVEAIKLNHSESVFILTRRYDLKQKTSEMLRYAISFGKMDIARMLMKDSDPEDVADAFLRVGPKYAESYEKIRALIQETKLKEKITGAEKKHQARGL